MESHPYIQIILDECRTQSATSPEEVAQFTLAYVTASKMAHDMDGPVFKWDPYLPPDFQSPAQARRLEQLVREWAIIVVPETKGDYRNVPAHFKDPTLNGLDPDLIPRAMEQLCEAIAAGMDADEVYQSFEEIHPFTDGNGRIGHLLWKVVLVQQGDTDAFQLGAPPQFKNKRDK